MTSKSSNSLIVTVIIALLSLGIGLVVGYLLRPFSGPVDPHQKILEELHERGGDVSSLRDKAAALEMLRDCGQLAREDPGIIKHLIRSDVEACRALTCDLPYPLTHVVYKLRGEVIDLDGRLDEKAWTDVGWTDNFVDIQGHGASSPRLETKVKMRYDDNFLFVGVFVEEPEIWANVTMRDGPVYQDNSLQILIDTRQSNVNYKEITVNARGTVADTMMTKSYVDGGEPLTFWDSEMMMAIHVEGSLNNHRSKDQYWTVEMAIPFQSLYQGAGASVNRSTPEHDEIWRANFLRAEWPLQTQDAQTKGPGTEWWVWQTPEVTNVHLPHKWGLIQFQEAAVNSTHFKTSDMWLPTNALLDTYAALKAFHANTGRYTDRQELLGLPAYILSGKCLHSLDIELDWSGFKVTAQSKGKKKVKGHTRTDHFLWFGEEDMQYF